ncbi:juvenile hormone acid O-methyltransferase-like isoform X1 [Dermacentor silvarum]|uniref:juvenile hormone acid O-methyltransferase-like isoform X1 n=1 Tax=Dermacentor silvarum TaxID=543639 RepID=UPI002101CB81|nr:juvenile hormone acid O-methyltransferase-like isoform X1 [Dermacentor silvarum]
MRPPSAVKTGSQCILDVEGYNGFEHHTAKEDLDALRRIRFHGKPRDCHRYLDIGCGPGTFTKDYLVSSSLPCKTILAIDKSPSMIDFAKRNSVHDNVEYRVFDFGGSDVAELLNAYGHFDRIYSLLCFHYVKDQPKAYRDIAQLLTPNGGECLVTSGVACEPVDAWLHLHLMERWRDVIPDPRLLYSNQFRFDFDKNMSDVESEMRSVVSEAGLTCIECSVYETQWPFPDVKSCVDAFFEAFELFKSVPPSDVDDAKKDWTRILDHCSGQGPGAFAMKITLYCVHAQSPVT